jgi:hypothetical protein
MLVGAVVTRVLITFSGADYDATTSQLVNAKGPDDVFVYDDVWLMAHPFYKLNEWIFQHEPKRCFGYCTFKKVIILDAMSHLADGDVVFYVDADCRPVANLSPIFDIAEREGACLFASCGHRQSQWCKHECYAAMAQPIIDAQAGCARFCAFRKGGWKEQQFLYEWLTYSVNKFANTKVTTQTTHAGFVEHRDEQAIMTNLAHKYGYKLHRECDQTGEDPAFYDMDRDLYPQMFEMIHQTKGTNGSGSRFRRTP